MRSISEVELDLKELLGMEAYTELLERLDLTTLGNLMTCRVERPLPFEIGDDREGKRRRME